MCVYDGRALAIYTVSLGLGLILRAFFSQAPGAVGRTVFTPDLKSGIPQAVEIPAPVKAMKCLELWMN